MKTKEIILNSVVELMNHSSVDSLSVKAIADNAGVSRRTFYNHFVDKYDAVNSFFTWQITREIEEHYNGKNWNEIAVFMCFLLRDHARFFLEADKAGELDRFSTFLTRWAEEMYSAAYMRNMKKTELTEDEKLRISFYALGNMVYVNKILRNPEEFSDPVRIRHYVDIVLKEVPAVYYELQ
ncbi:MAG: TetR family transcriptional regulator [Solobacterium sp.]|nr:TetR family transcriptional regulator [Solobacterium sp.]